MKVRDEWKRGVMTVEAAVIVPMSLVIIALLIGFTYYMHQNVWCKGSAAEAALYSVQRFADTVKAAVKAQERADARLAEAPLLMGNTSETAAGAGNKVTVTWEADIIPDYFNGRYDLSGKISVLKPDPVNFKQSQWVIGDLTDDG